MTKLFATDAKVQAKKLTAVIVATHNAADRERVLFNPTGGTFTVNAPASPKVLDRFGVKNVTTDVTAITVSGNGNNIEDPATPGAYVASASIGGAGISYSWEYDGTQWLLV